MNSPPISRVVSWRPPIPKLIMPSAGRGSSGVPLSGRFVPGAPGPKATDTGTPGVIARAASASVRAGTRAAARSPGCTGSQGISRTARR